MDSSGKHKIEAAYEKVENDNVFLKLTSGERKQIPLSMLSTADQDYVKDLLNPAPPEETPNEAPSIPEVSPGTETPIADTEEPMPAPPATPLDPPTGAQDSTQGNTQDSAQDSSMASVDSATDSLPDAATRPSDENSTVGLNTGDVEPTDSAQQIEPIIFYQKRIGDLDIQKIEPPVKTEGYRANPKYLFKVEREDLALLPRDFQGAALLLLDEPNNPRKAILALDFLKVRWPQNRQPTLIKLVINCASSDHKFNRESALKILADRDPDQSFAYILARVDDTSFTIRSLAYQMLRKIGDRRAIEPIAKRFASDDVDRISSLLRSFGSDSEDAIAKYLNDEDPEIRLKACNLIAKIGTEKSLPALEEMQQRETTMMLLAQTRSAINKIKRRSKSQSQ